MPLDLSIDAGVKLDAKLRAQLRRDVARMVKAAALHEGRTDLEVALRLCDDAVIHELNKNYRGKDKPTDVLSFEGQGGGEGIGDIVISVETAFRNARRLRRSLAEELDILALHGFLHTLGYDHETDDGTMERLERRLRRQWLRRNRLH